MRTFISNLFEGNPINSSIPLLKINNSIVQDITNCMLNNHITNYALEIIGGKMLPCHLDEIVDLISDKYKGQCLPTLGELNPIYGNKTDSYFIKTNDYSGPLVVIDQANGSSYAAFGLTSGIFLVNDELIYDDEWEGIILKKGWLILSETNYPMNGILNYEHDA
eukprot:160392_1